MKKVLISCFVVSLIVLSFGCPIAPLNTGSVSLSISPIASWASTTNQNMVDIMKSGRLYYEKVEAKTVSSRAFAVASRMEFSLIDQEGTVIDSWSLPTPKNEWELIKEVPMGIDYTVQVEIYNENNDPAYQNTCFGESAQFDVNAGLTT
ncbi:hypothetical protein KAR91_29645, partial [Candidatus Pacearchaeota archaeon]|nr:hypothetical protein [Candidatus Pacearchaeota archaeon]